MLSLRKLPLFMAACAGALAMLVPVATAAPNPNNQSGGAAGVVAAVVQVQDTLNNLQVLSGNENLEIVTVKDSLNNVLQNARFLNNITILQDFLNNPNCSVVALCDSLTDFLNGDNLNNNVVNISDVIAIDVLSGGDIRVYTTS